jgi:hypothetical protein
MVRPEDITEEEINQALRLIRGPLSHTFKAWGNLKDRDFVQMRMVELAQMMAWYARFMDTRITMHDVQELVEPKNITDLMLAKKEPAKALPERTEYGGH